MKIINLPCDIISMFTRKTKHLFNLLDVYIHICSLYIDKGTIERECEFNNQHHKIPLNNAFVLLNLLFFARNNTYACISMYLCLYL